MFDFRGACAKPETVTTSRRSAAPHARSIRSPVILSGLIALSLSSCCKIDATTSNPSCVLVTISIILTFNLNFEHRVEFT